MKILIVKTSALGDILHSFPVLSWIKGVFPQATVHWVVERVGKGLVEANQHVDKVISIDSKKWRKNIFSSGTWKEVKQSISRLQEEKYDLLFDLQGNTKSALVTYFAHAKVKVGFGKNTVSEKSNLFFTDQHIDPPLGNNIRDDYRCIVKKYFEKDVVIDSFTNLEISEEEKHLISQYTLQDSVLVCPGSAWHNKQLSPHTMRDFLAKMEKEWKPHFLFLWGSEKEHEQAKIFASTFPRSQVVDKLPLPVLQNLMAKVKVVITMDSLALHLCATTSTPSFSSFGPSQAKKYKPTGKRHGSIQGPCPYGKVFEKRCPILRTCPTGACLHDLSGEQVYAAFMSWWDSFRATCQS